MTQRADSAERPKSDMGMWKILQHLDGTALDAKLNFLQICR